MNNLVSLFYKAHSNKGKGRKGVERCLKSNFQDHGSTDSHCTLITP